MISLNNRTKQIDQRFRSLVLLTIITIYLLILAGGIVRGTGSGMGCPDWPKCFGRWIPPTEVSQLPPNYQQVFGAKLKGEVEFNAVKTWIEYVNRLLGVVTGFLVFVTLIASFSYWRSDRVVTIGSLVAFLLIGVNGWLGSKVVAMELAGYLVTAHLLLAIVVVATLLYVLIRVSLQGAFLTGLHTPKTTLNTLLFVVLLLTIGQIFLGTQVREALNEVVKRLGYGLRSEWVSGLNWQFYVHRSFSLVVLGFHLIVLYSLYKVQHNTISYRLTIILVTMVLIEILTGVIMSYFSVPAAAQPIHLLLAVIIAGLQFVLLLLFNPNWVEHKVTADYVNVMSV